MQKDITGIQVHVGIQAILRILELHQNMFSHDLIPLLPR